MYFIWFYLSTLCNHLPECAAPGVLVSPELTSETGLLADTGPIIRMAPEEQTVEIETLLCEIKTLAAQIEEAAQLQQTVLQTALMNAEVLLRVTRSYLVWEAPTFLQQSLIFDVEECDEVIKMMRLDKHLPDLEDIGLVSDTLYALMFELQRPKNNELLVTLADAINGLTRLLYQHS